MTKEASPPASSSPSVRQSDGAHSGWTPRTETPSGSQALAVSRRRTKLTIPSKTEGTSAVIDTTHTCAQTHTHAHRQRAINPAAALGSVWFPLTAQPWGPRGGVLAEPSRAGHREDSRCHLPNGQPGHEAWVTGPLHRPWEPDKLSGDLAAPEHPRDPSPRAKRVVSDVIADFQSGGPAVCGSGL